MRSNSREVLRHLPHPVADSFKGTPKDWEICKLDSLVAADAPICYGILMPGDDQPNGVPVVKVKNFRNGKIDVSSLLRTTAEIDNEYRRSRLQSGDVLLSIRGSVGQVAIACESLDAANITQDTARIRLNGECNHKFVFFALQSGLLQRQIDINTIGQAVTGINIGEVRRLALPIPPLPEQRKIAAILSTWDRAIELTEKLIAAKQRRKQALMQQLLTGKVRLPGFSGGSKQNVKGIVRVPAAVRRGIYPPSVQPGIPKLGKVTAGWQKKTMADLLRIEKRSVTLQDDEEYQLVVAKRNRGGIEPRERLRGIEIKTPTQFEVREGDFLISRRQIIHGACGVVPASLDGAVVSNEYSACTVNDDLDLTFLKYLTHTLYFQQTCFHASVGVTLEKMIFRLEKWLNFPFAIPPIGEQRAIAEFLTVADEGVALLVDRVDSLRRQKKGLMQQLLTGQTRLELKP